MKVIAHKVPKLSKSLSYKRIWKPLLIALQLGSQSKVRRYPEIVFGTKYPILQPRRTWGRSTMENLASTVEKNGCSLYSTAWPSMLFKVSFHEVKILRLLIVLLILV